jgi:cleavage and polyadenylation specificity factor subunit 1
MKFILSNRLLKSRRKELSNPQKNILDGDLVFRFFDLSFTDRNDISKRIKSSTEQVR